jgi:hypothetical protein
VRPHLVDHAGESLLELPAILGPGNQLRHRKLDDPFSRKHPPVAAGGDSLGKRLDDRRLPDSRLPDEHRVVLRGHHEDLQQLTDGVPRPLGFHERHQAPFPGRPGDEHGGGRRSRLRLGHHRAYVLGPRRLLLPARRGSRGFRRYRSRLDPRPGQHGGDDRSRVGKDRGKQMGGGCFHRPLPPGVLLPPVEDLLACFAAVHDLVGALGTPCLKPGSYAPSQDGAGNPHAGQDLLDAVRLHADLLQGEGILLDEPEEAHRLEQAAHADQKVLALDEGMPCHCRLRGGDLPGKAGTRRKLRHDRLLAWAYA